MGRLRAPAASCATRSGSGRIQRRRASSCQRGGEFDLVDAVPNRVVGAQYRLCRWASWPTTRGRVLSRQGPRPTEDRRPPSPRRPVTASSKGGRRRVVVFQRGNLIGHLVRGRQVWLLGLEEEGRLLAAGLKLMPKLRSARLDGFRGRGPGR